MTLGDGKAVASGGVSGPNAHSAPGFSSGGSGSAAGARCLAAWWKAGPVGVAAQCTALALRTGAARPNASASALLELRRTGRRAGRMEEADMAAATGTFGQGWAEGSKRFPPHRHKPRAKLQSAWGGCTGGFSAVRSLFASL